MTWIAGSSSCMSPQPRVNTLCYTNFHESQFNATKKTFLYLLVQILWQEFVLKTPFLFCQIKAYVPPTTQQHYHQCFLVSRTSGGRSLLRVITEPPPWVETISSGMQAMARALEWLWFWISTPGRSSTALESTLISAWTLPRTSLTWEIKVGSVEETTRSHWHESGSLQGLCHVLITFLLAKAFRTYNDALALPLKCLRRLYVKPSQQALSIEFYYISHRVLLYLEHNLLLGWILPFLG